MVSTGGTYLQDDIMRLMKKVHILVGTPGRILDLSEKKCAKLAQCKLLVLDEVDKLLSVDFQPIICKVLSLMHPDVQIIMVSATFPVSLKEFSEQYLTNPLFFNLMDELTLKGVT
jgi:ATP-dependent RNA helicase DDX6/DHH1